MAKCSKTNCSKPATTSGSGLCADHERLKKQADETFKRQKEQEEKKLKEGEEARKKAAELQKKNLEKAEAKKKKIPEVASKWNEEIKKLVQAVENLREKNPGKSGINAGTNKAVIPAGGGDPKEVVIVGGNSNPLSLSLPDDAAKLDISKAEVLKTISGFQNSDSGLFKFRRGKSNDIFIHCK